MNYELKAERTRQGKSTRYMAEVIGKSRESYYKKECGDVPFLDREILAIQNDLQLPPDKFNLVFFGGSLLFGNNLK